MITIKVDHQILEEQMKNTMGQLEDSDTIQKEFKKNLISDIQAHEFEKENDKLKKEILNLQSEIYGLRLTTKYLDKELAGR